MKLSAFRARAFLADPHAELDRMVAGARAEVERAVELTRLSADQAAFARQVNAARAAELRETLRKHAIRQARLRGLRVADDFGAAAAPSDNLAWAAPVGSA